MVSFGNNKFIIANINDVITDVKYFHELYIMNQEGYQTIENIGF
jgi:hypothetical protein